MHNYHLRALLAAISMAHMDALTDTTAAPS
jgi:hypothetical protein